MSPTEVTPLDESPAALIARAAHEEPAPPAGEEQRRWRQAAAAFLLTLAALLGSIATLNFVVNPLGVFPTRYFIPMVWNGRGEKIDALRVETPKPQILIFGSSRVWMITPQEITKLTGKPAFNAGVSVAMPEDDYALLRYSVEQAHIHPDLVVIGLDVDALHNTRPVDQRTQKVWELRQYLPRASLSARVARLKPLVTMESTMLSFRSIAVSLKGKAGRPPDPLYTVGQHGDTRLSAMEHRLATGESTRMEERRKSYDTYLKRWDGYTSLSKERLRYLQRTFEYCQREHIQLIVYMTPLYPEMGQVLEQRNYSLRRQQFVDQVSRLAAASGAQFFDHTDPTSFGGTPDGFMDGAHMDRESGELLAVVLLKEAHVIQ